MFQKGGMTGVGVRNIARADAEIQGLQNSYLITSRAKKSFGKLIIDCRKENSVA
jgi:hypothetical protein